jgi:hypothetical protein
MGLLMSFMIFTVSVWNILDTTMYFEMHSQQNMEFCDVLFFLYGKISKPWVYVM